MCQEEGEALGTHDHRCHGGSTPVSCRASTPAFHGTNHGGGVTVGNECDDGTQSRSANTTIDSSSVSDANWTVTAPGEELTKRKCW